MEAAQVLGGRKRCKVHSKAHLSESMWKRRERPPAADRTAARSLSAIAAKGVLGLSNVVYAAEKDLEILGNKWLKGL